MRMHVMGEQCAADVAGEIRTTLPMNADSIAGVQTVERTTLPMLEHVKPGKKKKKSWP